MDREEKEFRNKVKVLRELFRGRFKEEEIEKVLRNNDDNTLQALDFLMKVDPIEVGGYLKRTREDIESLREESCHLNVQLESGVLEVEASKRQFACKDCQRSWWRKVPIPKEVSKCHGCLVRYDPIPRDKEWGWGQFYCDCGNEFPGFAVMGMTRSRCHECGCYLMADHILPPIKKDKDRPPIEDNHDCNGVNCYVRQRGNYETDNRSVCIHPGSKQYRPRDAKYRTWSEVHKSTGSTICTFLDQQSLFSGTGSFAYSRSSSYK